jgi:ATP-binding cassette subfamily A (ABC1) protein 3
MVKQMDLQDHCDRLSGTYSGGNKRKLSVAMALVGMPTVLLLVCES